jgi:hypothetical protein
MTKSVLAVARQAVSVAAETLPAYSSPSSKKTHTRHQLFALLVVREFLKTDYRGLEQHLRAGPIGGPRSVCAIASPTTRRSRRRPTGC